MSLRCVFVALFSMAIVFVTTACTQGRSGVQPTQGLVFPGEARLGGSAAFAIDSNYILLADATERYDLHRDRVQIRIADDSGGPGPLATVRSVFSADASANSILSKTAPGAFVTVAIFDLPSASELVFNEEYPLVTEIELEVDGAPTAVIGSIELLGPGGTPTLLGIDYTSRFLEETLEPTTVFRLRGRRSFFQDGWVIGAIDLEFAYLGPCLENPRASAATDGANATTLIGPAPLFPSGNGLRLLVLDPEGFELVPPNPFGFTDPDAAGNGPLIDIAFDRVLPLPLGCPDPGQTSGLGYLATIEVMDVNGNLLGAWSAEDSNQPPLTTALIDPDAS